MARQGYCVPIECNQASMTYFGEKLFGKMNEQLAMLPTLGINMYIGIVWSPASRLGAKFTVPVEYNVTQKAKTNTGYVIFGSFILMLIIASLGTNVFWGLIHLAREKEKVEADDLFDTCMLLKEDATPRYIFPKEASHIEQAP